MFVEYWHKVGVFVEYWHKVGVFRSDDRDCTVGPTVLYCTDEKSVCV